MNINPMTWNWNQYAAAGTHIARAAAGAVGLAVVWHFVSPEQGANVTQNINDVVSGLEQAAKGFAGLIAAATLVYTSLKSASNASPASQVASVKAADPAALIQAVQAVSPATLRDAGAAQSDAVAAQSDVKAVVVTSKAVADASPSAKVTT